MQKFIQLKEYLLELSFLALLIRIICVGAGIGEALAVVSLVLSMAYTKWLNKAKVEQFDELKSQIENSHKELSEQLANLEESSRTKFDNIAAKFASQNLETAFVKKANDIQKLADQMDRVLNGESNAQQTNQRPKRLF